MLIVAKNTYLIVSICVILTTKSVTRRKVKWHDEGIVKMMEKLKKVVVKVQNVHVSLGLFSYQVESRWSSI
jgi:uncharacterized protein YegL